MKSMIGSVKALVYFKTLQKLFDYIKQGPDGKKKVPQRKIPTEEVNSQGQDSKDV